MINTTTELALLVGVSTHLSRYIAPIRPITPVDSSQKPRLCTIYQVEASYIKVDFERQKMDIRK